MASAMERRRHERTGYAAPLEYSLFVLEYKHIKKVQSSAYGVDASDEGFGFSTDYPLEPGHILTLRNGSGSEQTAMVRWVEEDGEQYRVGVLLY